MNWLEAMKSITLSLILVDSRNLQQVEIGKDCWYPNLAAGCVIKYKKMFCQA